MSPRIISSGLLYIHIYHYLARLTKSRTTLQKAELGNSASVIQTLSESGSIFCHGKLAGFQEKIRTSFSFVTTGLANLLGLQSRLPCLLLTEGDLYQLKKNTYTVDPKRLDSFSKHATP